MFDRGERINKNKWKLIGKEYKKYTSKYRIQWVIINPGLYILEIMILDPPQEYKKLITVNIW